MQMGTEGITCVAAQGNHLTSVYGIFFGRWSNIYLPTLFLVLQILHPARHLAYKGTQVAVYCGITILVGDMKHISRAMGDPYA